METMITIAAVIIVIGGLIAGIAAAGGGGNFFSFLFTSAGIIVFGFTLLGTIGMITEGVKYLEMICDKLEQPATQSKSPSLFPNTNSSNPTPTYTPPQRTYTGDWICPQCKEENNSSSIFCKYCGTHK